MANIVFESDRIVRASPTILWELLTDPARWPEYVPGLLKVDVLSGVATGVGTCVLRYRPRATRAIEMTQETRIYEPRARHVSIVTSTSLIVMGDTTLESAPEELTGTLRDAARPANPRTRVVQRTEVIPMGLMVRMTKLLWLSRLEAQTRTIQESMDRRAGYLAEPG
jgi:hypothetical protein